MRERLAPLAGLPRYYDERLGGRQVDTAMQKAFEKAWPQVALTSAWPLVTLVLESEKYIARLHDAIIAAPDGMLDYDMVRQVDTLWIQIRTVLEVVPAAAYGQGVKRERVAAAAGMAKHNHDEAVQRAIMLHDEADKLRASDPTAKKQWIAETLCERGFGGAQAIAKILRMPRPDFSSET